jgi:lambda family phage minor tail protein L
MSRALSALFSAESEKLVQKRILRLASIEVSDFGYCDVTTGSAIAQVSEISHYAVDMCVSVVGASGPLKIVAVGTGTVTFHKPADATLYETPIHGLLNIVDANHDVVFAGIRYMRFPVRFSELQVNSDGSITNSKLSVANVSREIMYYVESENGLRGRQVQMLTVHEVHLDEIYEWDEVGDLIVYPNGAPRNPAEDFVQEFFTIDGYVATELTVDFNLLPLVDLTVNLPRRKFTKRSCFWRYKDPEECGYTGDLPTCSKTLEDCKAHDNALRFGGFPGITDTRRVQL